MRFLLIIFTLISPFVVNGQKLNVFLSAGLSRNRISEIHYYNSYNNFGYSPFTTSKASLGRQVIGSAGFQVGIWVEKKVSDLFFASFFTRLELRSSINTIGVNITDNAGNTVLTTFPITRGMYVNPGLVAGFSPVKKIAFGSGISVPICTMGFINTGKKMVINTSAGNNQFKRNERFYSLNTLSLDIPFFFRLNTGKKTWLQVMYLRGITSRLKGHIKSYDNLFSLSFGIKL